MTDVSTLSLLGGCLCLDFTNTVEFRGTQRARDWLASVDDVIAWGEHAGALAPALAARLRRRAASDPARARKAFDRALALREAIYNVGSAIAAKRTPPRAAMAELNTELFALIGQTRISVEKDGVKRHWSGDEDALDQALWPLAWSAFDLLNGMDLSRLRECTNAECHWLFMDLSRNRSRRWCAMEICGNVIKARRHRQRT